MFTVKKAMNKKGYYISIGDYRPAYANDAEEISQAIKHYFGEERSNHNPTNCPFCKQLNRRLNQ